MIEGLAKAIRETQEQNNEGQENIMPDFIKKELNNENEGDDSDWAAETSGTLSFKGSMKDEDNYNYYMNEARKHKESAESNENWAKQRFEWAKSYADSDPSKAESYINEGRNWQSKARSEWSLYRDKIAKANSYK